MQYTVNQLAKLANISVRTLHYYDEIGLLKPAHTKTNGYRYYGEAELIKLQQILFFKELEFALTDIQQMLNSGDFDELQALQDQRRLLELKMARTQKLIDSIDTTIKHKKGGQHMDTTEIFASFDDAEFTQYQQEAKQRWGNTEAYQKSVANAAKLTKVEYQNLKEQGKAFTQKLADTMDKGATSPEFQELINQHYQSIGQFFECSLEMYRQISEGYITDARFAKYYDDFKPGLAKAVHAAIAYYCDQRSK
jgi:DNA-binding transcriptional MerR regulator